MSEWGSIGGYKTKAGALSSARSMDRRNRADRVRHPDWTSPNYETKIVRIGTGYAIKYRYPIKGGGR
jgi:hypothetical protein